MTPCPRNGGKAPPTSFFIVSERALTLRGFAEAVAGWWNRDADLSFVDSQTFVHSLALESGVTSSAHLDRSHSMSIEKARGILGYAPRYSSLEAVKESVGWLRATGQLRTPLAGVASESSQRKRNQSRSDSR
jgi:nucleoside-diphosphate-sugar epimerase